MRYLLLLFVFICTALPGWAGEDFTRWLADLRQEALEQGISSRILEQTLTGVEPIPRVIELDRKQPEFTLSFSEYLARVVSEQRVERGRTLLQENRKLLDEISSRYGVPPQFLVALWGVESDYGRLTGGFPVVDALVTLAFDSRRSGFFRGQLLQALRILDQGHISPEKMTGSWAGAMGQVQFIPSTYLSYAVDFDGDGRKDIWTTRADALASAANYLSRMGWVPQMGWGQPVEVPEGFDEDLAGLSIRKDLSTWRRLGVEGIEGPGERSASLLLPEGPDGPAFLVYENLRHIMRWNNSVSFALSVGVLADRIAGDIEEAKGSVTLQRGKPDKERRPHG